MVFCWGGMCKSFGVLGSKCVRRIWWMVSLQETGGRVRRMHLSLSTVFLPMDFSGGFLLGFKWVKRIWQMVTRRRDQGERGMHFLCDCRQYFLESRNYFYWAVCARVLGSKCVRRIRRMVTRRRDQGGRGTHFFCDCRLHFLESTHGFYWEGLCQSAGKSGSKCVRPIWQMVSGRRYQEVRGVYFFSFFTNCIS